MCARGRARGKLAYCAPLYAWGSRDLGVPVSSGRGGFYRHAGAVIEDFRVKCNLEGLVFRPHAAYKSSQRVAGSTLMFQLVGAAIRDFPVIL